jgi:hypothetical protein
MNIDKMRRAFQRFAKYRLHKIHLDWIISILSIPVLLTAVIINWGNLTHKNTPVTPSASPSPQVIIVPGNTGGNQSAPSCTKSIGPITISYPKQGQTVSDNPVCITIEYTNPSYCSVVWSYRINGGSWSDFTNSSPCLYNLPSGTTQFDLRVSSTVSSDSTTLSRSFNYTGSTVVATPTPMSSPTVTPTPTTVATSSAH